MNINDILDGIKIGEEFEIIDNEFGISSPVQNKIKHHLTVLVHGYSIRLNEMEDKK